LKILINPGFNNRLRIIKNKAKPFVIVEIENFLKEIEENPYTGEQLGKTDVYKISLESHYCTYIVVYEYSSEKNELIFWSIE